MSTSALALPTLLWTADLLHQELMASLDESFIEQQRLPSFDADWRAWKCVEGTKTVIRQSPLLGRGGGEGRRHGGLWKFAQKYVLAEGGTAVDVYDRCGYDRYQDFAFYSSGRWHDGRKLPLVIVEAESNPAELLGELAGLWSVRSPIKYLFITGFAELFDRLASYCATPDTCITEWAGTTYFVVEIPNEPIIPSKWKAYRADVNMDREKLLFGRIQTVGATAPPPSPSTAGST